MSVKNELKSIRVYFYDRILTDNEFRQNFNATKGRFGL